MIRDQLGWWCIVLWLFLMFSLINSCDCEADGYVEPIVPLIFGFVRHANKVQTPIMDLTYEEKDGRIYIRTKDGGLYGTVNLRNGVMFINGPGLVANGYCGANAEGDGIDIDTQGLGSVFFGRVKK